MSNTGFDHPDFTDFPDFTTTPAVNVNRNLAGAETLGPFYVGNFESLVLFQQSLAGGRGWVFTFNWWADLAMTIQTGRLSYRTHGAIPIRDQTPNRGPYVSIDVSATSYAGNPNYRLVVVPRTGTPVGAGAFGDGLICFTGGTSIGAGLTAVFQPAAVASGRAVFTVQSSVTTWAANCQETDELSALVTDPSFLASNGQLGATAITQLGPDHTVVAISNTGAAPGNFVMMLRVEV